ncbi:MAG TPA: phenylalanine--tRNA ligase subunit beta [Alphaproteobacteria bacterium]|nr:phenylalanine--tRNA ligase subunit beta [Alphaproteobacteria bacterium]
MKFTLSWLKDHLDTDASLSEITETLTDIGLEVEAVTDPAASLAAFRVAEIISAEPHPDADRLKLCRVDTGSEILQVVCGAPNARAGLKGVFAPPGSTIPTSGMQLKKTKIRGVDSHGMMCSESELGLSDAHDGIIELPDTAETGSQAADALGLDDPVIEIALTPNRGDCAGVRGIARDLAAAGLGTLKPLNTDKVAGGFDSPISVNLKFDDANNEPCPLFVGRYVKNVKNNPSPDWLQKRLKAIGLRPISALVDITNYISFDRGRPLHVYDADKLQGGITVRPGTAGETLRALDGNDYTLTPEACVIADDSGAIGLGGIMGGDATGSTDDTVNVLIESAYFDPVRTAATGRQLGIESDARYRFERGVDPAFVIPGLELATQMVVEICGGRATEIAVAGTPPSLAAPIAFRPERVRQLTGMDITDARSVQILESLGFSVDAALVPIMVQPPSWRPDIHGEPDLIEEIARIEGLDRLPVTALPAFANPAPVLSIAQRRIRWAQRCLAGRGLHEAVTWSFTSSDHAALFGGGQPALMLANPISSELGAMRPGLLPNLLAAAKRNADRGQNSFGLFEVGPQYAGDTPDEQSCAATGIRLGDYCPRHWTGGQRQADIFDVKADALAILEALGGAVRKMHVTADAPDWYHPGRSGVIRLGPKNILGHFGEIHPRILDHFEIRESVVGFEVILDALPLPKRRTTTSRGPLSASDLQAVTRDFAFILDTDIPADAVLSAAAGADPLIQDVRLFDLYEGEHVPAGKKSLAISITVQPSDKTLTDAEIDAIAAKLVEKVIRATGGALRG